jgi:hypothetical protein
MLSFRSKSARTKSHSRAPWTLTQCNGNILSSAVSYSCVYIQSGYYRPLRTLPRIWLRILLINHEIKERLEDEFKLHPLSLWICEGGKLQVPLASSNRQCATARQEEFEWRHRLRIQRCRSNAQFTCQCTCTVSAPCKDTRDVHRHGCPR